MRENMNLQAWLSALLFVICIAQTTTEATKEESLPVPSTNANSDFIDNVDSSPLKQTAGPDQSKDALQLQVGPSLATSSEDLETHRNDLPVALLENIEHPDDANIFSPANDFLYSDSEMYPWQDEFQNIPETGSTDYILLNVPEEDKRFMRGLKRDASSSEINEDKRFMRGLAFKRDFDAADADTEAMPLDEKRFMRGLSRYAKKDEKRFMRGLSRYAKKDEKRFMRGLRDGNFQDIIDNQKRFMRGLRNVDTENVEDKRFIVGLNNLARLDKKFMRGFGNYNKRFIHGLENYGKRFMRGLMKRDQSAALDNEKRFIVGLKGYGRRAKAVSGDAVESGSKTEDVNKRFIKGLRPYTNANHGKRFMKGFRLYSRKYNPLREENSNLGSDMASDKRFMRGLTKKQSSSDSNEFDKRFIKGLVKKSDGIQGDLDKRFIKGLVKKSDGNQGDLDKRFMKGLVKKSDGNQGDLDKRFIKGLVKKSDGIQGDLDKRFMKGLVKKSDGIQGDLDKRFIKGLVRKSEDDKRFMRGLHKKYDNNEDKRGITGYLNNENTLDQSQGSLQSDSEFNEEEIDKRFMRGLGKKNVEENDIQSVSDKRFMRGLYSKKESESDDTSRTDKRFMRGLYSKKESESDDTSRTDKRFMRGFNKFSKKDNELTDDQMNNIENSNAFDGYTEFDNEQKRFIKGLTQKQGKRFIKGLRNYAKKDDHVMEGSEVDADKRFMRGLVKKVDSLDGFQDEKRFIKGLVKKASDSQKETDTSVNDDFKTAAKNDSQLDKRFMRGLVKRESGPLREKRETRFRDDNDPDLLRRLTEKGNFEKGGSLFETSDNAIWHDLPAYDSEFTHNKRFMRGLGRYSKRDYDLDDSSNEFDDIDQGFEENQDISKRFMKGFLSHYSNGKRFHYGLTKPEESSSNPGADKRFIKGLDMYTRPVGKRFMRGLQQYGRRNSDDTFWEEKRFMRGLNPKFMKLEKRFMRGLGRFAKRPTDGESQYSIESYHRRFPSDYLNVFPERQLLSPSYRHSQFISSSNGDQTRQLVL